MMKSELFSSVARSNRTLSVLWQKPWKILADFPFPSAVGGQEFALCSEWLPELDAFRTIDWVKVDRLVVELGLV